MGKRFLRNVEKGAKFRKQIIKILHKYSKINPADCWMKPDLSIFKYKRLSIAFRERENVQSNKLVLSGIFRNNMKGFQLQGRPDYFYIFYVDTLIKWFYEYGKEHTHFFPRKNPSVEAAYLNFFDDILPDAKSICKGIFDFRGKKERILIKRDEEIVLVGLDGEILTTGKNGRKDLLKCRAKRNKKNVKEKS